MSAYQKLLVPFRQASAALARTFFVITHSSLALIGVVVLFVGLAFFARPELRQFGEVQLLDWLQARRVELMGLVSDPSASERATATDPQALPKSQATLAWWLSRKYRIAPEPLGAIVAEAFEVGQQVKLDPTLILAVMAVESGFNPFAQSPMGAQGLMQVLTRVHSDKYEHFGGRFAAFDPLANLRVGVKVLQDCIRAAGSLEGGLKHYVGAANSETDGGYAAKVIAEHERLRRVALGQNVPLWAPVAPPIPGLQAVEPLNGAPGKPAEPLTVDPQPASVALK